MCGIAGAVWTDPGRRVEPEVLQAMSRSLRHRGPDAEGHWVGPGVGLAHTRLAVIDTSPDGRQPMTNEDGTVHVVFNGEIYNFSELRQELIGRGHSFRSATDTEVLVHLYEEHGDDCVDHLDGMFAFALWDAPRRRLLLARDRVGKKPLKYTETPAGLAFASELKALLAAGLAEPQVDPLQITQYLGLGFVPGPGTGFSSIRKLPAGHRLIWEDGQSRIERYWSLDFRKKEQHSEVEWLALVRRTVEQAVRKRMVADVPLGAFLSGGIDSSIVVACMARQASKPIDTFSVGFDFADYDELPYARLVAQRYGTEHHESVVRADTAELLPRLAEVFEEPFGDCSALPSYLLARETRRHVTVALNGDGGDEGFAGYTRYAKLADWDGRLEAASRSGLGRVAAAGMGLADRVHHGLAASLDAARHLADDRLGMRYSWMMRLFSERQVARLTGQGPESPCGGALLRPMDDPRGGEAPIDRMLFADTMVYLPDDLLTKVDMATMAHGLEARSPLLDPELLTLAASIPAELKYRGGSLKSLLKRAFAEELPAEVVDRPKSGFVVPLTEWFRGPLLPLARDLLEAGDCRLHGTFDRAEISKLIDEHASGRSDHGRRLWSLAMLELWQRQVVAGASAPPTG